MMDYLASPRSPNLIEALRASQALALRSPDGVAPPAALLWTDPERQWGGLIPDLRRAMPQLFCLGDYEPIQRQGPLIWLKCVIDRVLAQVAVPEGEVPVLYLPGVSRQVLRNAAECPAELQPLVELIYRGAVWHQRNGRDWTVEAFLASETGLGLDVAQDARTRDALLRALPRLGREPVEPLRGRRLDADDFNGLSVDDLNHDLLTWMSTPAEFRCAAELEGRWRSFCDLCLRHFTFDPDQDGAEEAGQLLVVGDGKWKQLWLRFCQTPRLYAGIQKLLGMSFKDLFSNPKRKPRFNEEQEDRLRTALEEVPGLDHAAACARVLELEDAHGERRLWPWAQLGASAYAEALAPLAELARRASQPIGGASVDAVADGYVAEGWRCDAAALAAMTVGPPDIRDLVDRVVRALYERWLDQSARHLQALVAVMPSLLAQPSVAMEAGTCLLFVDGLRFDTGMMLKDRLEARGHTVHAGHRLVPMPTVTATVKPLATPVGDACAMGGSGGDFVPYLQAGGQPATTERLRAEMVRRGIVVMEGALVLPPPNATAAGWMECGSLDKLGHALQLHLARQIGTEVDSVADRVEALLRAGWRRVRVVTDHGWLLLPGGLPRIDLPPSLIESKWTRCALVSGASAPAVPVVPWAWNDHVRIATPPGIGSFFASVAYAHGGLSPQECVVPDLVVDLGGEVARARIVEFSWQRLRLRVSVETNASGLTVDIRSNRRQPGTTLAAQPKPLNDRGEATLLIEDDSNEGAAATIVVLDAAGNVLDHQQTAVGDA